MRLVTYDLPGFGESDPHPHRNLNTSALDMSYIATAVGFKDKFWVVGHSSGGMHAWAAIRYIPNRLAGIVAFLCLSFVHRSLKFCVILVVIYFVLRMGNFTFLFKVLIQS